MGMMEKKMETTTMGLYRVLGSGKHEMHKAKLNMARGINYRDNMG